MLNGCTWNPLNRLTTEGRVKKSRLSTSFCTFYMDSVSQAYLGIDESEVVDPIGEGGNLHAADGGEVGRIEDEHQVVALEIGRLEIFELAVDDDGTFERWRRSGDQRARPLERLR